MKNAYLSALIVALTFMAISAKADTEFNYTYTDASGVSATGDLFGSLVAPGEYQIDTGTITLSGADPSLNGTGTLVANPPAAFEVGGGTTLNGLDDLLFPGTDPQLDTTGGLAFQMASGLGVGIGGNGPGSYWIFGGNWVLNDNGTFSASAVATPEPATMGMIGGSLFLFGIIRRRRISSKKSV